MGSLSKFVIVAVALGTLFCLTSAVRADVVFGGAISINLASDVEAFSGGGPTTAVGSAIAGLAPVGHWNDVPMAQQTNLALVSSTGAVVPGLTLSTTYASSFPASAYDAGGVSFANPGDTAMMRGHIYQGASPVDLVFTGAVPYQDFGIIIYYNSGGISNSQAFSILDSQGGDLGLSAKAAEVPGGDTQFVLANATGTNNANTVAFTHLDGTKVPTDFIIRASGDAYKYFNGVQIVQGLRIDEPEPPTEWPGRAISVNFASDVDSVSGGGQTTTVGSELAGVVPVKNWNDVPMAQQTDLALVDSHGNSVPGLALSTTYSASYPSTAFDATSAAFAVAGDTAMMRGHIYQGPGPSSVDLVFTGSVPYDQFDILVYFNSGGIANTQTFSILDANGGDLGLSLVGGELPGGDAQYVLSDGANNANYVRFTGLDHSIIPDSFLIRASGDAYKYVNGLQIVQVPEPSALGLSIMAILGLSLAAWRRRW